MSELLICPSRRTDGNASIFSISSVRAIDGNSNFSSTSIMLPVPFDTLELRHRLMKRRYARPCFRSSGAASGGERCLRTVSISAHEPTRILCSSGLVLYQGRLMERNAQSADAHL